MIGLKDTVWLVVNVFAMICTAIDLKLQEYAAKKCREYLASLAAEEA